MDVEKEKLIQNAKRLLRYKEINSNALLKESLKHLKPTYKRSILSICVFFLSALIFNLYIFKNIQVVHFLVELTQQLNIILVPVFAVIITGYAIFQGLVNGKTLLLLTGIDHKDKGSKFEVYNLYFFGLSCIYLMVIIINNIILMIFRILPEESSFVLFSKFTNEMISSILLSFYIVIILNLLLNMKNFVYNLFQVFITNAAVNVIDSLSNDTDTKN